MCDIGGMVGAVGSLYSGFAGERSHNMAADLAAGNADMLRTQAKIAAGNADLSVTRGNYDEFLVRRKVGQVLGAETAHAASGNVDPTYGSPLLMQAYSAAQGETDAAMVRARMMTERADALTQSANIEGQAASQQFKSASEKAAAISALVNGYIGAGTSLLGSKSSGGFGSGGGGGGGGGSVDIGQGGNPFILNFAAGV